MSSINHRTLEKIVVKLYHPPVIKFVGSSSRQGLCCDWLDSAWPGSTGLGSGRLCSDWLCCGWLGILGLAVVGLAVVGFVVRCVVVGLLVWLAVHSVGRDVWFAFKQNLSPLQQLTKIDVIGSRDPALSHAWSPLQEFKILPILPPCPAFSHADMPLQAFSIFPAAPSQ